VSRIGAAFQKNGIPAFIGFTVAGDPDPETSVRIGKALIDAGTDILELGMPFSDPVADGPTIQKADERSLTAGTTPDTVFAIVRELRAYSSVPIVLLMYFNSVYRRGIARFYREAHDAGVDGVLIADMPVEESEEAVAAAEEYGIDPIFLVARTTSDDRLDAIVRQARGYVYLVSVLGVTGAREVLPPEAFELLQRVRSHTALPLALGFGISTPAQVKACADAGADGVIVGSAIVEIIARNRHDSGAMELELRRFVSGMKAAGNAPCR
jgi:tryptophan synthase alpha chain